MSKSQASSGKASTTSAEFYRQLCDNAGVGVIAVDPDLRICLWNKAAERLLDASAEERLGRPGELAVPEREREQFAGLLRQALETGQVGEMEMRHPAQRDAGMNLILTVSPVIGSGGRPIGASAWVRDISKRARLERWMARSQRMVSLGVMASGVAHHFNNILAGVVAAVDHALASNDRQLMQRSLQLTADAVTRATAITEHLLAFAQADPRTSSMADLTELMIAFVQRIEPELQEQGVELVFDHQAIPPLQVPANRWTAVLDNLLNNAMEALEGSGRLSVRVKPAGSEVQVSISDTGHGIPIEHIDRIFEPFFTTKAGRAAQRDDHIGLGLAVVHGLVKGMGGRIVAHSEVGQGTEFQVFLPTMPPSQTPQQPDSQK